MRTPSWRSCRTHTVAALEAHLDLGRSLGHFTVTGRQASWPSSVQAPGWGCAVLSLPSKNCSACCSECRARRGAVVHTLPTSSRPCKGKGTPPGDGSALREILGPTQCGDAPTKCTSGPLFPAHERGWSRGAAHGLAPPEARPAPGRGGWQRAPPVAHTEMAALHIEKERGRLPV